MASADFNDLPAVLAALHAGAIVGNRNAAKKVAQKATDACPVDIGFLRASVYRVSSDASSYWQATSQAAGIDEFRRVLPEVEMPADDLTSIVAYAASYALYVHDGARGHAARPWLAEAAQRVDAREEMAHALNAAIKAAAKHDSGSEG